MTNVGAVTLDDLHSYKATIKSKLGGDDGISELLGATRHNFDFWVDRDGTIYISDNGQGGKGGVETELNFFDLFEEFRPEEVEVEPQPERGDIDDLASDDDDQPQPGDVYDGADGNRYYLARTDGQVYRVYVDDRRNEYIQAPDGTTRWVGDY